MEKVKCYPEKLPDDNKILWEYSDCFADFPETKLCYAFLHKDYNMNMHKHEFYEINIVVDGEGVHYSKSGHLLVKRGDIFIIPPNTMHGYYSTDKLDVYHALFQDLFFKKYLKDLNLATSFKILFDLNPHNENQVPFHISCKRELEFLELEKIIQQIDDSIRTDNSFKVQGIGYVKSYILGMELIVKLCQMYEDKKFQKQENIDIMRCIEFFHDNYSKKINIDELCRISLLSRTALFAKFKSVTGMTPNEFLEDYRMQIARKLLEETNASITEISQKVGYYDSSHFVKVFRKNFGITPKQIR